MTIRVTRRIYVTDAEARLVDLFSEAFGQHGIERFLIAHGTARANGVANPITVAADVVETDLVRARESLHPARTGEETF